MNLREGTRGAPAYQTIASAEELPVFSLVPLRGPDGETLDAYLGVQRDDIRKIISVVSKRYGLVGHRDVAMAVHAIANRLEAPDLGLKSGTPRYPREEIRLYAGGRRLEHRVVIGRRFSLGRTEEFYPAVRVLNSLDGSVAVRVDGFALRMACMNQLYAGKAGAITELRELHLTSSENLLGQVERAIHEFLAKFDQALALYSRSMTEEILAAEVGPALLAQGLPRKHAEAIGGKAEASASHNAFLSRWGAYQMATAHLTHEVRVNPERERLFERVAAAALLLPHAENRAANL